jgi:hypothetical protein
MDINRLRDFNRSNPFIPELLLEKEQMLESYYSPFDYVNKDAKIVLIGISPGATQAINANMEVSRVLSQGGTKENAYRLAKNFASFSGPLRENLIHLLDYIAINKLLGINSCQELFTDEASKLVHYTSAFMRPVLKGGKPISTAKGFQRSTLLNNMVDQCLAKEAEVLGLDVIWVPLGQGVEDVLLYLASKGLIKKDNILSELPHPSGANAERIKYFLGKKEKSLLSSRTNPDKLDNVKAKLISQIRRLSDCK